MSVVSQNIKIFIEAYILGTLFYYIVRRCRCLIRLYAIWCQCACNYHCGAALCPACDVGCCAMTGCTRAVKWA